MKGAVVMNHALGWAAVCLGLLGAACTHTQDVTTQAQSGVALRRLTQATVQYRANYATMPDSVEALIAAGFVRAEDSLSPWGPVDGPDFALRFDVDWTQYAGSEGFVAGLDRAAWVTGAEDQSASRADGFVETLSRDALRQRLALPVNQGAPAALAIDP